MKRMIAFAFCLCAGTGLFAQNKPLVTKTAVTQKVTTTTAPNATPAKKATTKKNNGPAIGGFILDARKRPFAGVQAFLYNDSSIIVGSGYTDATGHYETNAVKPGKYTVKIVYTSNKAVIVSNVVIRNGIVPVNISAAEPEADTTITYASIAPVVEKKKPAPKKK